MHSNLSFLIAKRFIISLSAWLFISLISNAAYGNNQDSVEFTLQPRLCVISHKQSSCKDRIKIRWLAREIQSLCLHREDWAPAIRCWEQQQKGAHQYDIDSDQNVIFLLKSLAKDELLAQAIFEVIKEELQYRRRRRNPWSFF